MKKALFCLVLLGTCLLSGCGTMDIQVKICSNNCTNPVSIDTITISTDKFNDIKQANDKIHFSEFIELWGDVKSLFKKDKQLQNIENLTITDDMIVVNWEWNTTYQVLFDLTYYDWKTWEKGTLNKEIIEKRLKVLTDFFKENLQNWDKIILWFIWAKNQDEICDDKLDLIFGQWYTLSGHFEGDTMKGTLTYYYELWENNGTWSYSNIENIMNQISEEVNTRYGIYSQWTYLLHHLRNLLNETKENSVYLILSDFQFQLENSDVIALKNKYCSSRAWYCIKDSVYQVSKENLVNLYKENYYFKNLFTKLLFQNYENLNNLCPYNNKVYLFWLKEIPWMTIQDNLKDLYSNYLLKNCEVFYK